MSTREAVGRRGHEVRLRSNPTGDLRPTDFEIVSVPVGDPMSGQVLVRNQLFALDPALRLRLGPDSRPGYLPPIPIGSVPPGFTVGTIEISEAHGWKAGDRVIHSLGWREWSVLDPAVSALPIGGLERLDGLDAQPRHYLGALGVTGLTAYAGLLDVAELRAGDVVWVSAAAGAVGHLAAQIAKLRGHTVIGSAGSVEKVAMLTEELGLHAAFNHREGDLVAQLRRCAPDGIDVYFDNVGGRHLGAALTLLRPGGRVTACGAIAGYEHSEPGPTSAEMFNIVVNRLTIRGMRVGDHAARLPDLRRELLPELTSGRLRSCETVCSGLHNAPQALADLLRGVSTGRVLVEL